MSGPGRLVAEGGKRAREKFGFQSTITIVTIEPKVNVSNLVDASHPWGR